MPRCVISSPIAHVAARVSLRKFSLFPHLEIDLAFKNADPFEVMRSTWKLLTHAWIGLVLSIPSVARAEVYLLSEPITQKTVISRKVVLTSLGMDLSWEAMKAGAAYLAFGANGVAGSATYAALAMYPTLMLSTRTQLPVWAAFERRKALQKIANIEGVENIRIITAGRLQNHGAMKAELESQSVVFIETKKALPTELTENGAWHKLDDLDTSKLSLRLRIRDKYFSPPIEMTLRELFAETELDPALRDQWVSRIARWRGQLSIFQKINPLRGDDHPFAIEATLLMGDQTHKIGDLANGKSVRKILGDTFFQQIVRWVRKTLPGPKKSGVSLGTQTIDVRENITARFPVRGSEEIRGEESHKALNEESGASSGMGSDADNRASSGMGSDADNRASSAMGGRAGCVDRLRRILGSLYIRG